MKLHRVRLFLPLCTAAVFIAAFLGLHGDVFSQTPTYVEVTPAGAGVSASTHDGNVPANTVDNSLATRWSANGDGHWIRYDLGSTQTVSHVALAVYNGNSRKARFDLHASIDGVIW